MCTVVLPPCGYPIAVKYVISYQNPQRRGTARTLPNFCVVLCIVCFVSFYVLFVCKCVLYFCHRVAMQLQLNISYHIKTRKDGARPALFLIFCVVLCIVCFVSFYVLFVCICVLYFCHRVAIQLQLNISYHIKTRKDVARPALFLIFVLFYIFLCCSMYCLFCVVLCTVCV